MLQAPRILSRSVSSLQIDKFEAEMEVLGKGSKKKKPADVC